MYDLRHMKRVLLLILVLAAVSLFVFVIRHELSKRAQRRREAVYQSVLRGYTQALKPGMNRKEVEDYLRAKNAKFRQTCCVDTTENSRRHSWDDLTKIGEEDAPWFCSQHNVYVAFQFIDHVQVETGYAMKDDDLDSLRSVTLYHWLEECL
jgi:hypothetical protein